MPSRAHRPLIAAAVVAIACSGSTTAPDGSRKPQEPMAAATRVADLHHSTGGNVWAGGVLAAVDDRNTANGKSHTIAEIAYPNTPYPWENDPRAGARRGCGPCRRNAQTRAALET